MKVVYTNPILELTSEEENILSRAIGLLDSICELTDEYDNCEHKCPIYKSCPYHNDFTALGRERRTIRDLLEDIVNEAERETER